MRRFVIVLALMLVLFVVADFILKAAAENRLASAAQSEFDLGGTPEVSVQGWPFVFRVLIGSLPSVTVGADSVTRSGVTMRDVEVVFDDVDFSVGDLISGDDRSVRLRSARGRAEMTEEDLTTAARDRGAPVTITLDGESLVVSSNDLGVEAAGDVAVSNGDLVVDPEGELPGVSLPLPPIASGVRYSSVRVEDGRAVLRVRMGPTTLEF